MIDESLSRRFNPPSAEGFIPPAVHAAGRAPVRTDAYPIASHSARPAWVRFAAVAACLAMLAFSGWSLWAYFRPMPEGEVCEPQITRLDAFVAVRQGGFTPEKSLNEPGAAIQAIGDHVGIPLTIDALPAGVEIRGIATCPRVSPWCAALFARVDGTDVVVFFDRRAVLVGGQQARHEMDRDAAREGVIEHCAALDSVSISEISPHAQPRLIGLIREGK